MAVPALQPASVGASVGTNGGVVQAGESRVVEQHQPELPIHVGASILKGLAFGGGALVLTAPLMLVSVSWKVPVASCGVATGLAIMAFIVKPSTIVLWIEELTGADINGDGQIGRVHYVLDGTLRDAHGNEVYLKVELEGDNAGLCWHNFCRAVLYSKRNFSWNEAARHGIVEKDWKAIYRAFIAQQWVIPAKQRGTPRLKGRGWEWVKLYADKPPPLAGNALSFDDGDR